MKISKDEATKILNAVDVVCMNCAMDTLNTSVCDNCPVSITCELLEYDEE